MFVHDVPGAGSIFRGPPWDPLIWSEGQSRQRVVVAGARKKETPDCTAATAILRKVSMPARIRFQCRQNCAAALESSVQL